MNAFINTIKASIVKHRTRTGVIAVVLILIIFFSWRFVAGSSKKPQYQTATVTKGTLVVSLTESGQIVSTGNLAATTQASGIVKSVLVKNGDTVTQGQEIMEISPDQDTISAQTQALAQYQAAVIAKTSAQSQLEQDRAAVLNAQDAVDQMSAVIGGTKNNPKTGSPFTQNEINSTNSTLTSSREQFSADEKKYLDVDTTITEQSQSLQQLSTKVLAPNAGVITDITYAPGMAISGGTQSVTTGTGGSSSTTNSRTTTTVGMIQTDSNTTPAATFDLSEVDMPKVQQGQEATITLDAFPNKTFTGKVIGVNHEGVVSSGVVNYVTTIQFDSSYPNISSNMSATANIITDTQSDVLLVPTAAVQTNNGISTVQVLKNGQVTIVPVTIGEASDTQTAVTSGLNEGDTVVTGVVSTQTASSTGTSPFSRSLFGGAGGSLGGGGGARTGGGGGGASRGQ